MTPTSFLIDHTSLLPGIYLQAEPGKVYTYDLRFKAPKGCTTPAIKPEVMHTFEHCLASHLRDKSTFAENILYVGPMGCCTGFYLLMNKEIETKEIAKHLCGAFEYILSLDEIPAANAQQCGNYLLNDLQSAKELSKELLAIFSADKINTVYPVL